MINFATTGLHHVTAIARDIETNVRFYTRALGLRLVKRTVNFDDRVVHHLYYGDQSGRPGTLLTFFVGLTPVPAPPAGGRVTCVRFAVPAGSLTYWRDRLTQHDIRAAAAGRNNPGDHATIRFCDPDGLPLEIVAAPALEPGPAADGSAETSHRIRALHGIELSVVDPEVSAGFLVDRLGLRSVGSAGGTSRFTAPGSDAGRLVSLRSIDIAAAQPPIGVGQVHHVAFRAKGPAEQLAWREWLCAGGIEVTPIRDRKYFQSIYFHEPGGVRLEIATDGPGFTVDESLTELGRTLQLPDASDLPHAAQGSGRAPDPS